MPRPTVPSSLARPNLETRFHIDYNWWSERGRDLKSYMVEHLCQEHREALASNDDLMDNLTDWIDPASGQVLRVDQISYALLTHCSLEPDYITSRTSLVDGVFRALLAAGNRPMTPSELAQRTGRSPETILRTLSGEEIYRGLRPYVPET